MKLRKLFAILSLIVFLPVAACNTIEGVGQDTQAAGEVVSETARDVKN